MRCCQPSTASTADNSLQSVRLSIIVSIKPAFHDTDIDILATILATAVQRISCMVIEAKSVQSSHGRLLRQGWMMMVVVQRQVM